MRRMNEMVLIILTVTFFSCQKQQEKMDIQEVKTSSQENGGVKLTKWDQLPEEFRNAIPMRTSTRQGGSSTTARTNFSIVQSFGPYGSKSLTDPSFSFNPFSEDCPGGCAIAGIGIGHGDGTYVNCIVVWYKDVSGGLYIYKAGVGDVFVFHQFAADEYVKGVSGRSSTYLNSLTITTNKASFAAGGTAGTVFSNTALTGDWILGINGMSDKSRITQISFDVYSKPWDKLPGSKGYDIAVAADGTGYYVDADGKIFKWNTAINDWDELTGFILGTNNVHPSGARIAANANRVWMIDKQGAIYEYFAPNWKKMPGSGGYDITINSDGRVWLVNVNGVIYRYNEGLGKWDQMPGSGGKRIAAGGGMVWLINIWGNIYKWNGTGWNQMQGSGGLDIAVGNDSNVWLTNVHGLIFNYFPGIVSWNGSPWNQLNGNDGLRIAANKQTVELITASGSIRKLTY